MQTRKDTKDSFLMVWSTARGSIIISKANFILEIGSKIRNMEKVYISMKMDRDITGSSKTIWNMEKEELTNKMATTTLDSFIKMPKIKLDNILMPLKIKNFFKSMIKATKSVVERSCNYLIYQKLQTMFQSFLNC